jgi:hypothetical protein
MNKIHIKKLKNILNDWNPLGEKSSLITDLEKYETEATDILFHINKKDSREQIVKVIKVVLFQAFSISVDDKKCHIVAKKIHLMINKEQDNFCLKTKFVANPSLKIGAYRVFVANL